MFDIMSPDDEDQMEKILNDEDKLPEWMTCVELFYARKIQQRATLQTALDV